MKKFLVILLMLVYGASASGATLYLHYCCGKLDKISLTSRVKNLKGPRFESKGCCDNRQIQLKIRADQEPVVKAFTSCKAFFVAAPKPVTVVAIASRLAPLYEYKTGPPLVTCSTSLLIRYCIFRI